MMIPEDPGAYKILHDGAIALAQVENNGIRIDTDYFKTCIEQVNKRVLALEARMKKTDVYTIWRQAYGHKTSFASRAQLGDVLYNKMGFTPVGYTASNNFIMDADALESVDHPFVQDYLQCEKLNKCLTTYLQPTLEHTSSDGYLRCSYNLHLARTYRSSASDTNIQNQPVRDPLQAKLIRRGFIPRPNHRIVEIDYSSIEVRVAQCYHKDPQMMKYLTDPSSDMHRDTACDMFMITPEQMTKSARFVGKNGFVFPSFYGDFYCSMAKGIWNQLVKDKPTIADGTLVLDWLMTKGITGLGACDPEKKPEPGTYEDHIKQVEHIFWNKRFKGYESWKQRWYQDYLRRGYFKGLTGFVFKGYMRRNVVLNAPVQSAAFHCLLVSLCEVQRQLNKRRMKSKVIGQIHDSLIADVHEDEYEDYLVMAADIMTNQLKKRFTWIGDVPIDVEAEACQVGETWYDKKPVAIPG